MKFNQNEATNQRIERITTSHAVVGIDIAKETHVAQVTNCRGVVLSRRHLSFKNEAVGFQHLMQWIREVQMKHNLSQFIVGMEPTGHYWFNLANWLTERDIDIVLVNPATTKRNKENRDNSPAKNDPKDALTIADAVSRGYYFEFKNLAPVFEQLKTLMAQREFWLTELIRYENRIIRWLDIYFPEYAQVFPDWTCLRSLATLKAFPAPADLASLSTEEVIQKWREQGMKRAGGYSGQTKAAELLFRARHSIGTTTTLAEGKRELKLLLEDYERMHQRLADLQQHVEALLGEIPLAQQLATVKGLGTIFIAAILGCAGDLRHYSHGLQLLRRAGLNLTTCTSGKRRGQITLSKRGDAMLRKYLYMAVLGLVSHHPDFRRWHAHNVEEKRMKKKRSLLKLMGKLARILIAMARSGSDYRSDAARLAA